MSAWRASTVSAAVSASTASEVTRYSSVRLQVEIATASCTDVVPAQLGQHGRGAALGQCEALAQGERRGLVGDAEGQELEVHDGAPSRSRSASSSSSSTCCSIRAIFAPMIATYTRISVRKTT